MLRFLGKLGALKKGEAPTLGERGASLAPLRNRDERGKPITATLVPSVFKLARWRRETLSLIVRPGEAPTHGSHVLHL